MKILYLCRNNVDYMQDILYSGLVKLLGTSAVIDRPWNNRFHFNLKKYPRNIGMQKRTLFSSLLSSARNYDYDLVIVASCHPEVLTYYESVIDAIPGFVPVAFVDGGDWPDIAGDLDRLGGREIYDAVVRKRPFDFLFKREVIIGKDYPDNVFPLTFGFNMDRVPEIPANKRYDVAFWAVESHEIRTRALDLLQDKYDCRSNGTERNQVMKKYKRKGAFYLQELSRCRISLNFRGAGWDTLRYWEVPAVGGFMISQKPGIVIENNFVDGKEIVYCNDDLSDLDELCCYYLDHEEEREKIAAEGRKKLLACHTDKHRAEYVLRQCGFDLTG